MKSNEPQKTLMQTFSFGKVGAEESVEIPGKNQT